MRVGQIAERRFVSISANARIGSARRLFSASRAPIIPVIEDGRLVGIISEESIKGAGPESSVSLLMSRPPFIEQGRSIDYAIRYMLRHGLPRIPVVESAIGMRCIGIVASSSLLSEKKKEKKGR